MTKHELYMMIEGRGKDESARKLKADGHPKGEQIGVCLGDLATERRAKLDELGKDYEHVTLL